MWMKEDLKEGAIGAPALLFMIPRRDVPHATEEKSRCRHGLLNRTIGPTTPIIPMVNNAMLNTGSMERRYVWARSHRAGRRCVAGEG